MVNVTKTTLPSLSRYNEYLEKIWQNNWITNNGVFLKELENILKYRFSIKNFSAVTNATVGLEMALRALKIEGEVITTPFTFPATVNSIIWSGSVPVFADVDPQTFNIDPDKIESKITKNTKAILAVHVFGNACEVEKIEKIAEKFNLKVIYDSAHAFDVEYKSKSILNWGDSNVLSFHAAKVFHTIEGGAVIMKKKSDQKTIDLIRNHGIVEFKDKVSLAGTNGKMSEVQAAMGLCNLENFDELKEKRKNIYIKYSREFSKNSNITIQKLSNNMTKYNYSYFSVCFKNKIIRDKVYSELLKQNIKPRKYFYPSASKYPFLKSTKSHCPISENISNTILCLPLYASLEDKYVNQIIKTVNENA